MRDAFDDVSVDAVADALTQVTASMSDGVFSGVIRDGNGQTVGTFDVDEED
jgi:hypothetical protein